MPYYLSELSTLSLTAVYPYTKIPRYNTTVTEFPSGMEQRVTRQTQPRYLYHLESQNLTDEEMEDLLDFYVARQGKMEPFIWDDNGTDRYVRFNQDSLNLEKVVYNRWNVTIDLIEVHSSEIIDDT